MSKLIRNILGTALFSACYRQKSLPVAVLSYHGLSNGTGSSSWLRVNDVTFQEQISLLKDLANFITPEALFNPGRLSRARLNILLTFDDGYSNNYQLAFPVIKKYQIPALFFVSTWNMQTGEPFWFDRIIHIVQQAKIESLDLNHLGLGRYRFSKGADTARWDDIQILLEDIKRHSDSEESEFAESVLQWLQGAFGACDDEFECLPISRDQIAEMHLSGLCYFGSHSHRHRLLTKLPDATLAEELTTSREMLECVIGTNVIYISYPNGNYDERVKKISRESGFQFGFTTSYSRLSSCVDTMCIPRLLVGGYDTFPRLFWNMFKGSFRQSRRFPSYEY